MIECKHNYDVTGFCEYDSFENEEVLRKKIDILECVKCGDRKEVEKQ